MPAAPNSVSTWRTNKRSRLAFGGGGRPPSLKLRRTNEQARHSLRRRQAQFDLSHFAKYSDSQSMSSETVRAHKRYYVRNVLFSGALLGQVGGPLWPDRG